MFMLSFIFVLECVFLSRSEYVYVFALLLEIQLIKREGWYPINWFNQPHLCACLKLGTAFQRSYVVVFFLFFMFNELR
jgi:hypothetical protein